MFSAVSGLSAVFRNPFPRLFKEWKVVDRESSALKYVAVVKLDVGAVHNARGPVWLSGDGGDGSGDVGSRGAVGGVHGAWSRRRVGRRRRRGASRQAYQTAAGPACEPHSTFCR